MTRTLRGIFVTLAVAGLAFAGVSAANAAFQTGNLVCPSVRPTPTLTTNGAYSHYWTDLSNGQLKVYSVGGYFTSYGWVGHPNKWDAYGNKTIYSAVGACV